MTALALIFGGSFTLALSGALMPGPLLTVTIAESARRGFRAGPLLMTGHAILELFLVLAVIKGLGPYLRAPLVIGIIAFIGGAVLIWMGVDMVRTAGNLTMDSKSPEVSSKDTPHPFLMGILASISNPYWTIWWVTIGMAYLMAAIKFGYTGVLVFFMGHISADFVWYSMVSYGVSRGKKLLGDKSYQMMIRVCGIFLLGFGGWFLLSTKGYLATIISG
jgi:threonine/homoserine/homoserine lactone efflux protein